VAYGDNRRLKASDTFDSAIFGTWENGGGDWGTMQWASAGGAGIVEPTAVDIDSAIRRIPEVFDNNQYSKMTVHSQALGGGNGSIGVTVRMAAGTTETCYVGYALLSTTPTDEYRIEEVTNFAFAMLANLVDPGGEIPLGTGETITTEVENTTIRLGSNSGGSDVQKVTTTDGTIIGGTPGINCFRSASGVAQITSWEGGNIVVTAEGVRTQPPNTDHIMALMSDEGEDDGRFNSLDVRNWA
jgi:hypothetical protein